MRERLRHPFWQSMLVIVVAWLLFEFGIPYIPPLLGVRSAPVPNSVVLQFMAIVIVAVLLWASDNEQRWATFRQPAREVMIAPDRRIARLSLLIALPLLLAFLTFLQVRPTVAAPATLRSIHPAPPGSITFRGETMTLAGLENPLRADGSTTEDYARGRDLYYQNCLPCHGDGLAGDGHYAHGFNPAPLSFRDNGTIAQLTESFVFWRIAKGGPGLPKEGAPWNSAMPAWEEILTRDEIWAVIIFIYEQSGWQPRTWHEAAAAEGGAH